MKQTVGVVFGGRSGEHEISIRSARAVIRGIDRNRFDVVATCISKEGEWLAPAASAEILGSEYADFLSGQGLELQDGCVALGEKSGRRGLYSPLAGSADFLPIDVIFPVLHGTFGEDGTIQGLFEMFGMPYVGCGVLASSCGMDKVVMKVLLRDAGLPICKYTWLTRREFEKDTTTAIRRLESEIGYPMFVKPANLGSSVGVSWAVDADSLAKSIGHAAEYDSRIVIEESLEMREIECGVIGNDEPIASRPGEYIIRGRLKGFLDYQEKYSGTGNNEFVVPAPISEELSNKVRDMAVRTFKAIGGSGLARVDFFLKKDTGALLVNEINTMPGLTYASGFPKMWEGSGLPFGDVISELISLALERHRDRARNKTSFSV